MSSSGSIPFGDMPAIMTLGMLNVANCSNIPFDSGPAARLDCDVLRAVEVDDLCCVMRRSPDSLLLWLLAPVPPSPPGGAEGADGVD